MFYVLYCVAPVYGTKYNQEFFSVYSWKVKKQMISLKSSIYG